MKKFFSFIFAFSLSFTLFAEIKINGDVFCTDIWDSTILLSDFSVERKAKRVGFNLSGYVNYIQDLDIQDLVNFYFNFDSITNSNISLAFFYETENFRISPFFMYSNLFSSDGQIHMFPGKFEVPWFGTYGIKIKLYNNLLNIFYSSGNSSYQLKNDDSYTDILDISQSAINAIYKNNFTVHDFTFDTRFSYHYLWGSFNGELNNCLSIPGINFFEKIDYSGLDSLHIISVEENFTYKFKVLEFCLGISDYYIFNQALDGGYSWKVRNDFFSKLAARLSGYALEGQNSFSWDYLSTANVIVIDFGCNLNVYNRSDFMFHAGKKFYVPYKFSGDEVLSTDDENYQSLKRKFLLSGFNIALSIKY